MVFVFHAVRRLRQLKIRHERIDGLKIGKPSENATNVADVFMCIIFERLQRWMLVIFRE